MRLQRFELLMVDENETSECKNINYQMRAIHRQKESTAHRRMTLNKIESPFQVAFSDVLNGLSVANR
jgi:hypothetical protein